MEGEQWLLDLGPAAHIKDHNAHSYLRTFPRSAFHMVVVPEVAKTGARDLCCINRRCSESAGSVTRAIV